MLQPAKSSRSGAGEASPLAEVRKRIVRLLGGMGGKSNHPLASAALRFGDGDGERPKWMAWDRGSRLFYNVPFYDMKPRIALDPLMPRLLELARDASDRQSKVPPTAPHTRLIADRRLLRASSCTRLSCTC